MAVLLHTKWLRPCGGTGAQVVNTSARSSSATLTLLSNPLFTLLLKPKRLC